jgi:hypothetical protein
VPIEASLANGERVEDRLVGVFTVLMEVIATFTDVSACLCEADFFKHILSDDELDSRVEVETGRGVWPGDTLPAISWADDWLASKTPLAGVPILFLAGTTGEVVEVERYEGIFPTSEIFAFGDATFAAVLFVIVALAKDAWAETTVVSEDGTLVCVREATATTEESHKIKEQDPEVQLRDEPEWDEDLISKAGVSLLLQDISLVAWEGVSVCWGFELAVTMDDRREEAVVCPPSISCSTHAKATSVDVGVTGPRADRAYGRATSSRPMKTVAELIRARNHASPLWTSVGVAVPTVTVPTSVLSSIVESRDLFSTIEKHDLSEVMGEIIGEVGSIDSSNALNTGYACSIRFP